MKADFTLENKIFKSVIGNTNLFLSDGRYILQWEKIHCKV